LTVQESIPCLLEKEAIFKPQTIKKPTINDFRELDLLSKNGKIRLLPAQRYFNENDNYFPLLPQLYDAWRNESEYLVFRHIVGEKDLEKEDPLHIALKCSKRGNDVYNARIKRRFGFFNKNMHDLTFFSTNPDAFKTDKKVKTKLLWVTLTWNPRSYSIRNAWKTEIGKAYNRWISAIRRKYGKVHSLRSWEATNRGYPHIHVILWFEDAEFTVFPHYSEKEARMTFRIQEKHEFDPINLKELVSGGESAQCGTHWHSLVDVEAISSMKKMVNYVLKYQLKVNEGKEAQGSGSNTLAFMWLFRKRSYACSRRLQAKFIDSIGSEHNSNMEKEREWEFLGVFSGRDLGLNGERVAEVKGDVVERLKQMKEERDREYVVDQGISSWN
jgi:hypothetical protein